MRKRKFEPLLEKLTDICLENHKRIVTAEDVPDLADHAKILEFMESLGLMEVFYTTDGFSHVQLTNAAIRYSYDQWIARKNAVFNYFFGMTSGIAIGLLIELFTNWLQLR